MSEPSINVAHLPGDSGMQDSLAELLAEAFFDDSTMIRLMGKKKWQQVCGRYMALQIDHASLAITTEDDHRLTGVLLAKEPGMLLSGWRSVVHLIRVTRLLGSDFSASQKLAHEIAGTVPKVPHWYINQIGVSPANQSHGTGIRMIRHLMQLAAGNLVYVDCESSLSGFYGQAGFELVAGFEEHQMVVMGARA